MTMAIELKPARPRIGDLVECLTDSITDMSDRVIQALCVNCEYFDGGGMAKVSKARETMFPPLHGDCGHRNGPNFETTSTDTCSFFLPDSSTWPGEGIDPDPGKVNDPDCRHTDLEYLARLRQARKLTSAERAFTLRLQEAISGAQEDE